MAIHVCFFVYDSSASAPGIYVTICRGCGTMKQNILEQVKADEVIGIDRGPLIWDTSKTSFRPFDGGRVID